MRICKAWFFAVMFIALVPAGSVRAADALQARQLERAALTAYTENDRAAFLARMTEAVALRPDHPRLLFHLAAAQAVNDQPESAVATLGRIADLGVSWRVPREEEFESLWERDDFQRVLARLDHSLSRAIGAGVTAFTLLDMPGLIEGIAWRKSTGEFFFGDVHERCVWRRATDGGVTRFTADDGRLFGVFGLAIDETRGALWAATSAMPEMRDYAADQQGAAGVAEFDLETGALRRVVLVPVDGEKHVLGDLALAPDGTVFATDSVAPVLWCLPAAGDTLEAFAQNDEFMSLQGIAFTADGRGLWLTAYGNGLLHLDLATRDVRRLATPPATTLLGCDGLACTRDGSLIAVQNGVTPARILRITPNAGQSAVVQVRVLEAAHAVMADATLGCMAHGDFVFIADGGWSRFGPDAAAPAGPRAVPILRVTVD